METVELEYPITLHGAEVTQLTLRRPTVRDRLIAEKSSGSEVDKEVRFIANLCELAPDDIEKLDTAIKTALITGIGKALKEFQTDDGFSIPQRTHLIRATA